MAKKAQTKPTARKTTAGRRRKAENGKLTQKQKQFLEAFREIGNITRAAQSVGINRWTHHVPWMKQDRYKEEFEKVLKEYEEADSERVKDEIRRRAYDGWDEEITDEEIVERRNGTVERKQKIKRTHKWSTACLLWLGNLHHGNPARLEVTGPDGGPVETRLSLDKFRKLAGLDEE